MVLIRGNERWGNGAAIEDRAQIERKPAIRAGLVRRMNRPAGLACPAGDWGSTDGLGEFAAGARAILSSAIGLMRLAWPANRRPRGGRQAHFLGGFAPASDSRAGRTCRVLDEVTADRAGHRQADVGIDVDLAHAMLDAVTISSTGTP